MRFDARIPQILLTAVDRKYPFGNGRIMEDRNLTFNFEGHVAVAQIMIAESNMDGAVVAHHEKPYTMDVLFRYIRKLLNEGKPDLAAVITSDQAVRDALQQCIDTKGDHREFAEELLKLTGAYIGSEFPDDDS